MSNEALPVNQPHRVSLLSIVLSAGAALSLTGCVLGGAGSSVHPNSDMPGFSYENCDEAREYGAAPLNSGDLGYGRHLDRDGDGIACEPWFGN